MVRGFFQESLMYYIISLFQTIMILSSSDQSHKCNKFHRIFLLLDCIHHKSHENRIKIEFLSVADTINKNRGYRLEKYSYSYTKKETSNKKHESSSSSFRFFYYKLFLPVLFTYPPLETYLLFMIEKMNSIYFKQKKINSQKPSCLYSWSK